jgi:hypothetical protein
MRNIRNPYDKLQPALFHDEEQAWWASRLAPNALRALQRGWEGVFRRSILKLLPAYELGEKFDSARGRPTKELFSMAGLVLVSEFKDLTIDQAAQAYTFDASVQYALNLPRDGQYVSPRTVDNYRRLFRENEFARQVFEAVTGTLVEELGIEVSRQRLDSTHVLSNMARLGRRRLLAVGVRRFLVQLAKHRPESYGALAEELRERYRPAESRLFFGEPAPGKGGKDRAIERIGQDMAELVLRFEGDAKVGRMESFRSMRRLFEEHFEPSGEEGGAPAKRPRSVTGEGRSAETLQNPSDPGAGYNGKKGAGYQAQIAQTLPPKDAEGEAEGPGLLTVVIPQSASVRDSEVVGEVLDKAEAVGARPEELSGDTLFGSDANMRLCEARGVRLISPVGGRTPQEEARHNATSAERARRERLDGRRARQETEEWKRLYAPRSGIEGVNRALDLTTGFKRLRVRGIDAVGMALLLKGAGWNIAAAVKIKRHRWRKAELKAAGRPSRSPWSPRRALAALANRLVGAIRLVAAHDAARARNGIFSHVPG